jgi:hypothetical protein
MHVHEHLGQIDDRQHRLDPLPQVNQRRRVAQLVQPLHRQPHPAGVAGHDPHAGVRAGLLDALGELPPCRVKGGGVLGQVLLHRVGQAEAGQQLVAYRLPLRPVQQPGAWVGPAQRRVGEHVAPPQRGVQLGQQTHHVGVPVGRPVQLRVAQHCPPPHRRHQGQVQIRLGQWLLLHPPAQQTRQPPADLDEQVLTGRRRAQRQLLGQQPHERAHHPVAGGDGLPVVRLPRVRVGHQLRHGGHRPGHLGPGAGGPLHRRPQLPGLHQLGRGVQQLEHGARHRHQRRRRLLQPRHRRQPCPVRRPPRRAEQPGGHQRVEQVQGVVDRGGLQPSRRGQQCGRLARLCQPLEQRRLAGHAVAGQRGDPVDRHRLHLRRAGADRQHLVDPRERPAHRRPGVAARRGAQPLQLGHPLARRHLEQVAQPQRQLDIRAGRRLREALVGPPVGLLARRRHQPGQHARPRQQHPLSIQVELSQSELATMIGTADVTVQKAIRALRRAGLIKVGYRQITVDDIERLGAVGMGEG